MFGFGKKKRQREAVEELYREVVRALDTATRLADEYGWKNIVLFINGMRDLADAAYRDALTAINIGNDEEYLKNVIRLAKIPESVQTAVQAASFFVPPQVIMELILQQLNEPRIYGLADRIHIVLNACRESGIECEYDIAVYDVENDAVRYPASLEEVAEAAKREREEKKERGEPSILALAIFRAKYVIEDRVIRSIFGVSETYDFVISDAIINFGKGRNCGELPPSADVMQGRVRAPPPVTADSELCTESSSPLSLVPYLDAAG